jgi:DNA-binding winged helix-turn-helix (wHTH) protein
MTYKLGSMFLFDDSGLVSLGGGEPVRLTPAEFALMRAIVDHCWADKKGDATPRSVLFDALWPDGSEPADREKTLNTQVWSLRRKLGKYSDQEILTLKTYRLTCPVTVEEGGFRRKIGLKGEMRSENCPYPGTLSFRDEQFADVFFGREQVARDLRTSVDSGKTVQLVCGPSGVGKTSLLTVGLRQFLSETEYLYVGPLDAGTGRVWADGKPALGLLRLVLGQLGRSEQPGPDFIEEDRIGEELGSAIASSSQQGHCVLCFDQMENFFREHCPATQMSRFMEILRDLKETCTTRLTIIIAFRKEFLFEFEYHVRQVFGEDRETRTLWKFSPVQAKTCLIEPAIQRGVWFTEQLADHLTEALTGMSGGTVNPMDIQRVGRKLWMDTVRHTVDKGDTARSVIDSKLVSFLLDASYPTAIRSAASELSDREKAGIFVSKALADSLGEAIARIATRMAESEEYITLCLVREFVGFDNTRLRVRRTTDDDEFVGKLPIGVIRELETEGLVQRSGEDEFELAHDALAVEITRTGQNLRICVRNAKPGSGEEPRRCRVHPECGTSQEAGSRSCK